MKSFTCYLFAAALLACSTTIAFAEAINLNTATIEDLETLNGIGPEKAEAIIKYREEKGKFKSVDELKNINGIGKKTLEQLRSSVTVSGGAPAPASAPTTPAAVPIKAPMAVPPAPVVPPAQPMISTPPPVAPK